jgi:hypothetical protein
MQWPTQPTGPGVTRSFASNQASIAAVSSFTNGMVRLFIDARITPDIPSSRRGISKRTVPRR